MKEEKCNLDDIEWSQYIHPTENTTTAKQNKVGYVKILTWKGLQKLLRKKERSLEDLEISS